MNRRAFWVGFLCGLVMLGVGYLLVWVAGPKLNPSREYAAHLREVRRYEKLMDDFSNQMDDWRVKQQEWSQQRQVWRVWETANRGLLEQRRFEEAVAGLSPVSAIENPELQGLA